MSQKSIKSSQLNFNYNPFQSNTYGPSISETYAQIKKSNKQSVIGNKHTKQLIEQQKIELANKLAELKREKQIKTTLTYIISALIAIVLLGTISNFLVTTLPFETTQNHTTLFKGIFTIANIIQPNTIYLLTLLVIILSNMKCNISKSK